MNILRMKIENYGVIQKFESDFTGLTIIFGDNETGKTFIQEFIIRVLFGKEAQKFDGIARDPGVPYGYILLNKKDGNNSIEDRIQYRDDNNWLQTSIDLEAEYCKKLFIVHNSDLLLGKSEKENKMFFDFLTEEITGVKLSVYDDLADQINEDNFLTDSGEFVNKKGKKKYRDAVKQGEKITSEIETFIQESQDKEYDKRELQIINLHSDIDGLEKKLADFKLAKNREDFQHLTEKLNEIGHKDTQISEIHITAEDQTIWSEAESFSKNSNQEDFSEWLQDKVAEQVELEAENALHLKNTKDLDKITPIIETIQVDAPIYQKKTKRITKSKNILEHMKKIFLFLSILTILGLVGLIFQPSVIIFPVFAIFSGLGCLIYILLGFSFIKLSNDMQQLKSGLISNLNKLNLDSQVLSRIILKANANTPNSEKLLDIDNLNHYLSNIQSQQQEISDFTRFYPEKKVQISQTIQRYRDKLSTLTKIIQENEKKIEFIQQKSLCSTLKELQSKLIEKQGLITSRRDILQQLNGKYNENDLSELQKLHGVLSRYKDMVPNITHSEIEEKIIEEDLTEYKDQIEKLKSLLQKYHEDLVKFTNLIQQNVFKDISPDEQFTLKEVHELADLKQVRSDLKLFTINLHQRRSLANKLKNILTEIKQQEESVLENIIEEENLNQSFSKITEGHYIGIKYDSSSAQISVIRKDQRKFKLNQLSFGTKYQLYFCIRIALTRRLFQDLEQITDDYGFFLLDDPFLRSDLNRKIIQMEYLESLAQEGWQFILFTIDNQIKDLYSKRSEDYIKFIDLNKLDHLKPID
jgi:hypothetical protein